MPACCAVGCTNRNTQGFKFYKLPRGKDNELRRKIWLSKIQRDFTPSIYTVLCEVHFEPDQFENGVPKKLRRDAIPTIFNHSRTQKKQHASQQKLAKKKNNCNASNQFISNVDVCFLSGNSVEENEKNVDECILPDSISTNQSDQVIIDEFILPDNCEMMYERADDFLFSDNSETHSEERIVDEASLILPGSNYMNHNEQYQMNELPILSNRICVKRSAQSIVDELLSVKSELKKTVMKLNHLEKTIITLQQSKNNLLENISRIFNEDQLNHLQRSKSDYKVTWSKKTITESLRLKQACGVKGYNKLIDKGFPLPSLTTLRKALQISNSNVTFKSKLKINPFSDDEENSILSLAETDAKSSLIFTNLQLPYQLTDLKFSY